MPELAQRGPGEDLPEPLIRVTLAPLCFGLVARRGTVVRAAPVAAWCVGEQATGIVMYWQDRGAKVERL